MNNNYKNKVFNFSVIGSFILIPLIIYYNNQNKESHQKNESVACFSHSLMKQTANFKRVVDFELICKEEGCKL